MYEIEKSGNMHEQARLACPFPAVGKGVGDLVSICEVKTHYATSDAANSALSFACADCNVPVSARIIQNYVQDRKVTPSSGFRASDRKQPHTCNREPSFIEASLAASGAAAAHSSQRGAPERWVDPRKAAPNTGTTTSTPSSASASVGSASRGRNGPAVGQSVGQSQTVEKFAREWRQMSPLQRKSTPLVAPWNVHGRGSYFSAFHPLGYFPNVSPGAPAIYTGTARHVTHYSDGYDIELNECLSGGRTLHVWIPVGCLSMGGAGAYLTAQLFKLSQALASPIPVHAYALGRFDEWPVLMLDRLVLEVEHPHMCWIE